MHIVRAFEREGAAPVGWGIRVLLLSSEGEDGLTRRRLANLGGQIEVVDELFTAMSELIDDPAGYALFVVDCDGANVGGLEAARRAVQMLGNVVERVPVILVSRECGEQRFPNDRLAPTVLRAPLTSVSLRVGFEHALHDRLLFRAA
ncbi:MAG: hypothetical protein ABIV25_02180 [Paracoccaceae bacterium]